MKNILYILLFLPLAGFGQDNYSLSFDGEDDYVEMYSPIIPSSGDFSVSIWAKALFIEDGLSEIVSQGSSGNSGFYIGYDMAGQMRLGDDWDNTGINFPIDGFWHYYTLTKSISNTLFYIDGFLVAIKGSPIGNPEYSDFRIAKRFGEHGEHFNGLVINLEIWNIALSSQVIQNYMQCPPIGTEDNLIAYWNFNEGSGDTVYDRSGNENHGIIYGATYSEDVPENNCYGCTDNLATNYDDLAGVNDSSCIYNTYPIEDENFKAYLQSNYPQTIVNDSLNLNATLGIEDLNVDSLGISSLEGLQYFYDLINLNCVANNLSTLPELPSQIEYINCQWNQIDTLPNFPESLKNFDGRHNLITIVPALPNTMEVLRVCFNEVTTIPELPDSLKILFCAYNYEQLTYLPDFPDHLEEVLCFDNEIEQISDIPETMYKFMMQNNSITQIPNIPEGVNILNLSNNPIECVNDYPEQFEVQLGSYPPCSFLDEYTALMDSLSSVIDSLDITLSNLDDCNTEAINALSSLQLALYNWNTIIDLQEGWNMFGYGCPSPIDVAEGLSNHTESILLVKDNNGSAYIPEWDFNGIGDFTPGFGYQIKLSDAIEGFSLCDWYVNDIPEDNIVTLQEDNYELQEQNLILLDSINLLNQYEVGDFEQGGIIFYIDESGKHGLVAAHHDVSDFVNEWGQQGLNWGCSSIAIDGADGVVVGTGLQNSLDVVSGCQEDLIAASVCLNYVIGSYDDWYLPSIDELYLVLNTIGPFGLNNNLGEFLEGEYLSSTEYSNPNLSPFDVTGWAFGIITNESANPTSSFKGTPKYVRPIRSF